MDGQWERQTPPPRRIGCAVGVELQVTKVEGSTQAGLRYYRSERLAVACAAKGRETATKGDDALSSSARCL
jgi:hypothetical protein